MVINRAKLWETCEDLFDSVAKMTNGYKKVIGVISFLSWALRDYPSVCVFVIPIVLALFWFKYQAKLKLPKVIGTTPQKSIP